VPDSTVLRRSCALVCCGLAALTIGGCGGGEETSAAEVDTPPPSAESPPPSEVVEPEATEEPEIVAAEIGVAQDREGDRAEVTVEMGEAVRMADVEDETALACEADVERQRSSPERSVAIPFTVSMTVVSSLATDVSVNLDSFGLIQEGGDVDPSGEQTLSRFPLWAGGYSEGASCTDWSDVGNGAGLVHWDPEAAQPHTDHSWSAWLIVPDAITPRDPNGSDVSSLIVEQPTVTLSGLADYKLDLDKSSGIVECFSEYSLIPGEVAVMAQDPSTAVGEGCTTTSATGVVGETAAQADSDAICNSRYPSGQIQTVSVKGGTDTIYDRQASLETICAGFGAPEGLHLTPGMSCALIAAVAVWAGPEVNAGSSKLCDTTAIVEGYESGGWAGVSSSVAQEKACGYFSDVFAGGAGIFAAGATVETGPGAVAVGVGTYKALASFLNVACGGLLGGGASNLGKKLEADHETAVSLDVSREGKCLMLSQRSGLSGTSWHAVDCRVKSE
jgi:hypothetical protein